jgi:hypothetical protein
LSLAFYPILGQPLHMPNLPIHLLLTRLRDSRIRNAGPNFLMLMLGTKSASVVVPKTLAKIKSSPSGTRRCCVSSFASDSRLTSQPKTCNFVDKSSCVQPLRSRNSRTRIPIKFSGNETFLMLATVAAPTENIVRFRSQIELAKRDVFRQGGGGTKACVALKIVANSSEICCQNVSCVRMGKD